MSCPALTNKGGSFAISTNPVAICDPGLSDFEGFSYTDVGSIGSSGDTGFTTDVVTYPIWDDGLTPQGKGDSTGNNPTIEFLHRDSAGMDIMLDAAAPSNQDSYAWRYTWANGDIEYGFGQVSSTTYLKGGGSDVRRISFVLVSNLEPLFVYASP